MIVYQPAFDLYHAIYRIVNILGYFNRDESIEIERLRIWDYYFLFPNKMKNIRLKQDEKDVRIYINTYIVRQQNPYEEILNDRKMFERIRPYQMSALKYLASIGLINKDYLDNNRITKISKEILDELSKITNELTIQEKNTIRLLTSHFYFVPIYGKDGLKDRTNLLESKYDA
ncbi:ABC-three component system middle component 5 [Elizabethkingia anophelis]|uniref:ABC-three component system middle component 5 n=1 Tax=Elizabethkingia anophelis TaxID=1117645 RepID=UPI0035572472